MNDVYHAVVWLDHSEAKVFRFDGAEESEVDIHSHSSLQRLHHRRDGWEAGGNPPDDTEFFQRIIGALDHTGNNPSPELLLALGRRYFRGTVPTRPPGDAP